MALPGREGVSAKGRPGRPSSLSWCPCRVASRPLREALTPALCLFGQCSLKLCPEPSLPTCLHHGPSLWGEKEFITHHGRPPLIPCCSSGLGVTFSLAGEQTLGNGLSRDSLPASREGTMSCGLGKACTFTTPLACAKLVVRGKLLPQGSRSLGKCRQQSRDGVDPLLAPLLCPHSSDPGAQPSGP